MTSPFEDPERSYLVLTNPKEQHSLWPADLDVPAGWSVVHGPDSRTICLGYVETHWTDLRPASSR